MEDLSPLSGPCRIPLAILNSAWLQNHRFLGQAVLPGVWALEHLARAVGREFPDAALPDAADIHFDKFLILPAPDVLRVEVLAEVGRLPNGDVQAALLTRHVAPKSGISRMKTHARVRFGRPGGGVVDLPAAPEGPASPGDAFQVGPERLYAEMVPFGRAFQNVVSAVRLSPDGARAVVSGGEIGDEHQSMSLGSPFPLDAAFHAACAWAQRFCGVVAFPVAMQERRIRHRARFGQCYDANVLFQGADGDRLRFDLWLHDQEGRCCEWVRGLAMRDVSRGKLQPPVWIRPDPGNGDPT
jgi:hypothetical protein